MISVLSKLLIPVLFLSACESSDVSPSAPSSTTQASTQGEIHLSPASILEPDLTETDFSHVTIKRFAQVEPGVFRGARPNLSQMQELAELKIKTVIDLQGGDATADLVGWFVGELEPGEFESDIAREAQDLHELGIPQFINEPLNSFNDVDQKEALAIENTLRVMADPEQRPVFVHCGHGKDRTGLVVALYRVEIEGWNPQAAHDEMVEMGHHGHIDQFFTGALDRYFYRVTGWHPTQN